MCEVSIDDSVSDLLLVTVKPNKRRRFLLAIKYAVIILIMGSVFHVTHRFVPTLTLLETFLLHSLLLLCILHISASVMSETLCIMKEAKIIHSISYDTWFESKKEFSFFQFKSLFINEVPIGCQWRYVLFMSTVLSSEFEPLFLSFTPFLPDLVRIYKSASKLLPLK